MLCYAVAMEARHAYQEPDMDEIKNKMILENWPLERFVNYAANPRKNDHAVDKLVAAIKEFGFRIPIVAKSDGLVVDGHLRLKAAKKLGLRDVPVLLADDLTDAQIKAFRISVNRMAELAEWDNELLALELLDLADSGFNLDLTGFDDEDVEEILSEDTKLREKTENLSHIKMTRILISVPVGTKIASIDGAIKDIVNAGGSVDYGGN